MRPKAKERMIVGFLTPIIFGALSHAAMSAETRLTLEACHGADCEKRNITPEGGYDNLFACMAGSQIAAAQWLSQNKPPDWTVKRITCSDAPVTAEL